MHRNLKGIINEIPNPGQFIVPGLPFELIDRYHPAAFWVVDTAVIFPPYIWAAAKFSQYHHLAAHRAVRNRIHTHPGFLIIYQRKLEKCDQIGGNISLVQWNMDERNTRIAERISNEFIGFTHACLCNGFDDLHTEGWSKGFSVAQQEIHMFAEYLVEVMHIFVRADDREEVGQGNFGTDQVAVSHQVRQGTKKSRFRLTQEGLSQAIGKADLFFLDHTLIIHKESFPAQNFRGPSPANNKHLSYKFCEQVLFLEFIGDLAVQPGGAEAVQHLAKPRTGRQPKFLQVFTRCPRPDVPPDGNITQ